MEAATYAIRYYEKIRRYYERKASKTSSIIAKKTVAHKLARATYHVIKERVAFEIDRAFR